MLAASGLDSDERAHEFEESVTQIISFPRGFGLTVEHHVQSAEIVQNDVLALSFGTWKGAEMQWFQCR